MWRENDPGYADALKQLTAGVISYTSERTGDGIRIGLDIGLIHINPAAEEVFVEIALLNGFGDGAWMCWRPGEESFEHVR